MAVSNGIIIALSDYSDARRAGEALSRRTARELRLVACQEGDLTTTLVAASEFRSACIVVGPSGFGPEFIDFAHMAMVMRCCRRAIALAPDLSAGILTAPDTGRFWHLIEHGMRSPSRSGKILAMPRTGPPWLETIDDLDYEADTVIVPTSCAMSALSNIKVRRYDAMVIEGHGRSYCVNEGQFCTGREADGGQTAELRRCLGRFDCAGPNHVRLPADTFSAGLLVLDACEAGGFGSPAARLGAPPISLAALRASDAVITSDIPIVRRNGDVDTLIACLRSSETLGDLLRTLNKLRASGAPEMPYHLLGDPAWPCPASKGIGVRPTPGPSELSPLALRVPLASVLYQVGARRALGGDTEQSIALQAILIARALEKVEALAWPHHLWSVAKGKARLTAGACHICGTRELFAEVYEGFGGVRKTLSCSHCRLISDSPAEGDTSLLATVRNDFETPRNTGTILIEVRSGAQPCLGAVALGSGVGGKGPSIRPKSRTVTLAPRQAAVLSFRSSLLDADGISQIFYFKVLAILNGRFHLAGVPIALTRDPRREAVA